jgi:hypothetical protein
MKLQSTIDEYSEKNASDLREKENLDKSLLSDKKSLDTSKNIMKAISSIELKNKMDEMNKSVGEYNVSLIKHKEDYIAAKAKHDLVKTVIDEKTIIKDKISKLENTISNKMELDAILSEISKFESIIEKKTTILETIVKPRDEASSELASKNIEITNLEKKIKLFEENGECPTCGSDLSNSSSTLRDMHDELKELSGVIVQIKSRIDSANNDIDDLKLIISTKKTPVRFNATCTPL